MKRLHEYKRQHLNVLYLVTLYNRLKAPSLGDHAAHGHLRRQSRARLPHGEADHQADQRAWRAVINQDPSVSKLLKVVFLPDFNVKNGQRVYPAADLSEQISTAGKEASGTGNMKFAMNGALTIGTLDGANVEIRDAVGHENFFLFGLTAAEVVATESERLPAARLLRIERRASRRRIDLIAERASSRRRSRAVPPARRFAADPRRLHAACRLSGRMWTASSASARPIAIATTGRGCRSSTAPGSDGFSSDRSIRDYCRDIWHVSPIRARRRRRLWRRSLHGAVSTCSTRLMHAASSRSPAASTSASSQRAPRRSSCSRSMIEPGGTPRASSRSPRTCIAPTTTGTRWCRAFGTGRSTDTGRTARSLPTRQRSTKHNVLLDRLRRICRRSRCVHRNGPNGPGRTPASDDAMRCRSPPSRTPWKGLAAQRRCRDADRSSCTGYTPTPAISHAILTHNRAARSACADGIVITPSHNPPEDGGFKYNPPRRAGGHRRHARDRGQRATRLLVERSLTAWRTIDVVPSARRHAGRPSIS